MNADDAKRWIASHVSRETMDRLEIFHAALHKWQKTINLVAPSTLENAWARHFLDSAQILDLAPHGATRWLDLGSGGGFPGLVVATIAKEKRPDIAMTLVESDIRKCGFMREAAREMDVAVKILSRRIADIPLQHADVISARALSNLSTLVNHAKPHMALNCCLLFPKGTSYREELETLPRDWQINVETIPSLTDPDAVVLRFLSTNMESDS